jgi:hypothetical protein
VFEVDVETERGLEVGGWKHNKAQLNAENGKMKEDNNDNKKEKEIVRLEGSDLTCVVRMRSEHVLKLVSSVLVKGHDIY